jgi:hypothetical protein
VTSSVSPERCDIIERIAIAVGHVDGASVSLSEPIWLTLTRMRCAAAVDPALEPLDVGDEEVVADELGLVSRADR